MVSETAMTNPRIKARFWSTPPIREKTVPVASVASETKTVSQPTKIKYESTPGTMLPFTPKDARARTMVGAFERLPASELIPTKKKEHMVPIIAAQVACLNEIPNPKKNEPYDRARSETFAPAHGQKSDLAFPLRSDSWIVFGPFSSRSKAGTTNFSVL